MKCMYENAKVYINDKEVGELRAIDVIGIEPEARESSRFRWSRGFRITGTATVTPSWEGMTEADKRKVERASKKIKGAKKHRKRVANRQKLYEKKHSEPFDRRMAKICKRCSFRHNFNVDGKYPEDWRDLGCGEYCEHPKGGEVLEKEWRRQNR